MTADPASALHGVPGGYEAPEDEPTRLEALRSRVLDSAGLGAIQPPQPLIDGWLYADSLNWLTGKWGHGKSFLALDMAGCVSAGHQWFGAAVTQASVLYCIAEGIAGLPGRVRAWEDHHGQMGVRFLPGRLSITADYPALCELISEQGARLVIFDTQAKVTVGLDENSSKDMGQMINALETIRERTGACVLMVHHEATAGGDRPRGHSVMDGAATAMLRVVKDGTMIRVHNTKQKDARKQRGLTLVATPHLSTLILQPATGFDHPKTDSEDLVFKCLSDLHTSQGGASNSALKEAAKARDVPVSTFNWALKRLVEQGLVRNTGSKRATWYELVPPGEVPLPGYNAGQGESNGQVQ